MPAKNLEANVRHQSGVAVVDLQGELNGFAEERLSAVYTEAEHLDTSVILLNFSDVDYINSTGIALIVNLLTRARKTHRRLLAYGLSDHYTEIFQITRLADFIAIFPDEASALASISGSHA